MKTATTDNLEEIFVVVDRNDKVLGYRSRRECHRDKKLIHRAVGVVIFDKKGRILLQKRSLTKDLQPGYWAISSAGHVSKGETYEAAAKRELAEELGINVPVKYVNTWLFEDDCETEMDVLYQVAHEGPFRINPEEIDEVAFFSKKDLAQKISSGEVKLSTWAQATLAHIDFL